MNKFFIKKLKTMKPLVVDDEERKLIQESLQMGRHPGFQLRNMGVAYDWKDEYSILEMFPFLTMKQRAMYADLVTQAMGSNPEFYMTYFHVEDEDMEKFDAVSKNPTLLGNIAFMALNGPPLQRWRYIQLMNMYDDTHNRKKLLQVIAGGLTLATGVLMCVSML